MADNSVAILSQDDSKKSPSLIETMGKKFGVDPAKLMNALKCTAFRQSDGSVPSNEQMMALLVVANQYNLNPFLNEIYAFPSKKGGIVPVVGVDGWSKIINSHPQLDGIEFRYSDEMVHMEGAHVRAPEWMEVILHRKDRSVPTTVREYLDEVYRKPGNKEGPWQTHTKRFFRHKTLIQGARIGFGFVGIYDEDEAERIIEAESVSGVTPTPVQSMAEEDQQTVDALIERARKDNCWRAALDYVTERFEGNARDHAKAQIMQAELAELRNKAPEEQDADQEAESSEGEEAPEQAQSDDEQGDAQSDQGQQSLV